MANTVKGADQVVRKLRTLAARFPNEVGRAMFQEAQIEMTEAKRRTPVDTGALRASGTVHAPTLKFNRDVEVVLSFGSVAVGYATRVHEDLDAFHKVGQAKYLESTLNESRPFLAARIARRIELERLVL